MPVFPTNPLTPQDAPAQQNPSDARRPGQRIEDAADPVERADRRRLQSDDGDVSVAPDGTVTQKPHGNMDETLVPKGKDHPEQGSYTPEHDHVDPDLQPSADNAPRGPKHGT